MAQRGLEDWEISVIKRMIAEGYARDKMHAYFNRPERTLTPAAFSEIKAGMFGTGVPACDSRDLARFVENFSKSPTAAENDPVGIATIARLVSVDGDTKQLIVTENSHIEFKASFSFQDNTFSKILRAIAAMANNSGGYIICGVEDGSGTVLGLKSPELFESDLARWSMIARDCLMPLPVFERRLIDVAGKKVGLIYVEPARHKPVVATKNFGEKIRSGAIYYRYPGQSADIAYGELACLLSERDRRSQHNILDTLRLMNDRLPTEVALIDLKEGRVLGGETEIELPQALVNKLSIIRRGEFVEEGGAPAVRIVADATIRPTANDVAPEIVRGYVSDLSAVRNFAHRQTVREPLQYFLAAINSSSDWLPIFRWLREAGINHAQAVAIIEEEGLTPTKRQRSLERLEGRRSAKQHPQSNVKPTRNRLLLGDVPDIGTPTELRRVMLGVRAVDEVSAEQLVTLWSALQRGYDFASAAENGGDLLSYVKAAAARVDELKEALDAQLTQRAA